MNYTEFLSVMGWELEEQTGTTDIVSQDSYKFLPSTQAQRIINEVIKGMVRLNPNFYEMEYTHTFSADADYYEIPESIYKINAIWYNSAWTMVNNQSDFHNPIRSVSARKLYNEDGWESGDELKMIAVIFPPKVFGPQTIASWDGSTSGLFAVAGHLFSSRVDANNTDVVNNSDWNWFYLKGASQPTIDDKEFEATIAFSTDGVGTTNFTIIPESAEPSTTGFTGGTIESVLPIHPEYDRFFELLVKERVFGRKSKAWTAEEQRSLMEEKLRFKSEKSRIARNSRMAKRGHSLGRRV